MLPMSDLQINEIPQPTTTSLATTVLSGGRQVRKLITKHLPVKKIRRAFFPLEKEDDDFKEEDFDLLLEGRFKEVKVNLLTRKLCLTEISVSGG